MSQNDGVRAGFRAAHEAPDGSSPKASIPDAEIEVIARIIRLHRNELSDAGWAVEMVDPQCDELAERICKHLEQSE